MFMHMKGITHPNGPTTISLQCCVIINGLEYIGNPQHRFFFPLHPIPNNIAFMNVLSLSFSEIK